jgi:hypothetical protein
LLKATFHDDVSDGPRGSFEGPLARGVDMSQTTKQTSTGRKKAYREVEIRFFAPREGAPDHLLANAELHFKQGLLRGNWLTGFSLWRAQGVKGEFISVTVPSREGEDRFYDWLRGDLSFVKKVMVKEYAEWNAAQAVSQAA